jgi:O-antigen ligase/polysaccharide polymerase Wzy-like membrane protein
MEVVHRLPAPRSVEAATRRLALLAGAVALFGVFLALGAVLSRNPLPIVVLLAIGIGLLGTLFLALARYHAAVALGVVLFAAVRLEPAPADLVFAVVIAVAFVTGRFAFDRVPLSVTLLVSAFLALNLFASIEVIDAARAVEFFAITLYLGIFGIWLAGYVRSVRRARLVLVAYVLAAVASAALACVALFLPLPGREAFIVGPRAQGLFKDPNVFGPFLVPAALILMEETVAPRLLRLRVVTKLLFLSVVTVGVLFSFSRAAWLNLVVGSAVLLIVLLLRRGGARKAMTMLAVGLLAAAALFAAVSATSTSGFLQQRASLQVYDVDRFGAQLSGLDLAAEYPLGIGPGQFERVSELSAHSTYVRALAEEGVLGALVLLGLMLLTLGFAARNAALGRSTYGIGSAALLAAWCGLLANSLFIDTLHWRHLWLLAALIWAGTALRPAYPSRYEG